MTLDQLRIFVAVAEREHVTRAAVVLNLTQSAVSTAISMLEAQHSIQLFDRVGRRIVLTEPGRLFLDEARGVLARAEQATRLLADLADLADLAGLKRGKLRLAASQTVANYWLPQRMQRFHAAHPGVTLELVTGNTAEVAAMVHAAVVDLGFVEGEITDGALARQSVPGDQLALVVAPDHPWAVRSPGPTGALRDSTWVLRETGSGTRAAFEALLTQCGLSLRDVEVGLELPSNEAVRLAVESGAGATILSTLVVESALDSGRLVRVALDLPSRLFHVLRHKERHLSKVEQRFLEVAAQDAG